MIQIYLLVLIFSLSVTHVFAQESPDPQYVSNEDFSKLMDKIEQLEQNDSNFAKNLEVIQNQNNDLTQQIRESTYNSKLSFDELSMALDGLENKIETNNIVTTTISYASFVLAASSIIIAFFVARQQRNQGREIQTTTNDTNRLAGDVHSVTTYLDKRIKGKERYAAWAMKSKLDFLEINFKHILEVMHDKWKNEKDPVRKNNFYNSMRDEFDRCFEMLKLVSLPPLELRDIYEDATAGMIQTLFSKVGIQSSLYFDSGGTIDESMPAFINHVKETREICKNVMDKISPLASSYVKPK